MSGLHKRYKVALVGCGFIGSCHADAIRRIGLCDLVAVTDANPAQAQRLAAQYGAQPFLDVDALLAGIEVDAVHNCTPNFLHRQINEKIIHAGKHVFSEKPLATSSADSECMLELLQSRKDIVHGVNFNYRMYPMIQQMRHEVMCGGLGRLLSVHGVYLQDHMLKQTDYSWKAEQQFTGPSRCVADIGSHWMDLVEHLTGAKISEVCADLATFYPVREKRCPDSGEAQLIPITTEDYGSVLFHMDNGVRGAFCVSNASAGRKNHLRIELDGSEKALSWDQESPNALWMGYRDQFNHLAMRDPALLCEGAQAVTHLPAGHNEGWADALHGNIEQFYRFIQEGKHIGEHRCSFATFEDGHHLIQIVEAILRSHASGRWVVV